MSYNITKAILSLQYELAITDIIFRSNLLHHFQKEYYTKIKAPDNVFGGRVLIRFSFSRFIIQEIYYGK
jgi:hypothetical protein